MISGGNVKNLFLRLNCLINNFSRPISPQKLVLPLADHTFCLGHTVASPKVELPNTPFFIVPQSPFASSNKMTTLATYAMPPAFLAPGGAEAWREASDSDDEFSIRRQDNLWQTTRSKKRVAFREEVTAYDAEEPEEDNCTPSVWPQQQRVLPPLKAMLEFSFPPPKSLAPLKPEYVKQHVENQMKIEKAIEIAAAATAKAATAEAAVKAHADEKVGAWSHRAQREALATRLGREFNEATAAKKTAEAAVEKVVKESFLINSIVTGHKKQGEIYKKHQEALFSLWDLTYGKHTPVKRSVDIWGRYECRGEKQDEETGVTRFEFAPGEDLEQLSRECQIGGHEWIRISGDTLLLKTDVLKSFEP